MCTAGAREARPWLFVAVFVLHVALGDDPEKITFDQAKMRSHLLECFEKKKLTRETDFHMNRRQPNSTTTNRTVLSCLVLETYGDMEQCDHM